MLHLYKLLTLMNQLFNQIFSNLGFQAFVSLNLSLCIFAIFGCISMYHEANILLYSFYPCVALTGYIQFYGFSILTIHPYEDSKDFVKNLSMDLVQAQKDAQVKGIVIILKQLRSCRAIKVGIGSHYIMRKNVKMISLGIIINSCVYLLLA